MSTPCAEMFMSCLVITRLTWRPVRLRAALPPLYQCLLSKQLPSGVGNSYL
jgi:hypothetical protein